MDRSSADEYDGYVAALNKLETDGGGVRKGWSTAQKAALRDTYDAMLSQWPWLEGFWVRWAESEYKLGDSERAIAVYRRALDKQRLPHSVTIWVSYLSFLTHVCHIGPSPPAYVQDLFAEASSAIGSHFLSHGFWDLYLEWSPDRVALLLHILNDLTIHQYARFYAQLVELLQAPTTSLVAFASVIPNESARAATNDEEARLRNVIQSRLNLKYELQTRRVNTAFAYERQLKRPFFHPRPLPRRELDAWLAYIDASPDPTPLYTRALIPAALDAGLWLKYIRSLIARNAPPETVVSAMEGAAATRHVGLILYYALWLELNSEYSRTAELYSSLLQRSDAGAAAVVQYSQYLARRGEGGRAESALREGFSRFPTVAIIEELAKYGENICTELSWPDDAVDTESTDLWRAKLVAFPALADEIFEQAPENSITADYLALLARTDAAKFLEVDRMVHRSALNAV